MEVPILFQLTPHTFPTLSWRVLVSKISRNSTTNATYQSFKSQRNLTSQLLSPTPCLTKDDPTKASLSMAVSCQNHTQFSIPFTNQVQWLKVSQPILLFFQRPEPCEPLPNLEVHPHSSPPHPASPKMTLQKPPSPKTPQKDLCSNSFTMSFAKLQHYQTSSKFDKNKSADF